MPAGDAVTVLDGGGGGGGAPPSGALVVSIEPNAPIVSVPRVLRVHASLAGFTFDPQQMMLVEGTITPRQLTNIREGKIAAAIAKRVQPVLTWSEAAGEALAPTVPLDAGGVYTLVMADVPAALELTVAAVDTAPLLPRLWPPEGASATAGYGAWCGTGALPEVDVAAATAPAGIVGKIATGVAPGALGRRCVRFVGDVASASEGLDGGLDGGGSIPPSVAPPVVEPEDAMQPIARLDPRPLQVDVSPPPLLPAACVPGEVPFGPGCATVLDDRIMGRSSPVPLLWAVTSTLAEGKGSVDVAIAAVAGGPFVVTGLAPSSRVSLDVTAVDTAGRWVRSTFTAQTLAPAPHVVINEVLAWPFGTSPEEEWVELTNDGPAPAALDGYVLSVGGAATPLPPATVAPGAFALVVGDGYVAMDGPDVAPPPGALLLQVPHLGKRGLAKKGEILTLLDASGATVSTFPADPKPKQGSSVARRTPSSPDGLATSFALATPTPGQPNTW